MQYWGMTLKIMHLSITYVEPEGGGGSRAYVGHLVSIAFPALENLIKKLGHRVAPFVHGGIGLSHIVPCARLCTAPDFHFVKWSMPLLEPSLSEWTMLYLL